MAEGILKRIVRFSIFILLISTILLCARAWAISIKVKGSWCLTIDESDLRGGPGSDLKSTYESTGKKIHIDIKHTKKHKKKHKKVAWAVDVKRVDTKWDPSIRLDVKRTTDGKGHGKGHGMISDGRSWQEVTDTPQRFFTGTHDRKKIGLRLRIRGVSVKIPADTYTTTVYYTVFEQ